MALDVATLAVKVDTRDLKKGGADMDALTVKGQKAEAQIDDLGMASKKAGRSISDAGKMAARLGRAMGGFNHQARMVSMQLSQVASQGAVTGNYLQALAIQAPDLALGFGAIGIAAGALVPVLYGVASAAFGAQEAVEDIDIGAAYNRAKGFIDNARDAQERYTAAVALSGRVQQSVTRDVLASLQLEAQAREALADLEIARLERQRVALSRSLEENKAILDDLLSTASQGLEFDPNAAFANTEVERQRLQNVQDILAANEDLVLTIREQQAEQDLVNALLAQGSGQASEMVDELLSAAQNAESTAGAIAGIDFSTAISGAVALSDQLGVSLHTAMQVMGLVGAAAQASRDAAASVILDPRDPNYDPIAAEMQRISDEGYGRTSPFARSRMPRVSTRGRSGGGGGGGGGGGRMGGADNAEREAERAGQAFDRLMGSLDPLLDAQQEFADNQKIVNDALAAGKITAADYEAAMAAVGEAYTLAVEEIESANLSSDIRSISEDLAAATDSWESFGQAAVGALQRIAQEFVANQFEDILRSLAGLSPLSREGGGGLIGALFGGFRAEGGPVSAGKAYVVGEKGPEIFAPSTSGQIIPNGMAKGMSDKQVDRVVSAIKEQTMNVTQNYVNAAGPDQVASGLRSRAARNELRTFVREEGLARG